MIRVNDCSPTARPIATNAILIDFTLTKHTGGDLLWQSTLDGHNSCTFRLKDPTHHIYVTILYVCGGDYMCKALWCYKQKKKLCDHNSMKAMCHENQHLIWSGNAKQLPKLKAANGFGKHEWHAICWGWLLESAQDKVAFQPIYIVEDGLIFANCLYDLAKIASIALLAQSIFDTVTPM